MTIKNKSSYIWCGFNDKTLITMYEVLSEKPQITLKTISVNILFVTPANVVTATVLVTSFPINPL